MTEKLVKVGRIAFREEGAGWNAYYAAPDTMKDAIFLGSMRLSIAVNKPDLKQEFMDLMRSVVSAYLEDTTGRRPSWLAPERAPESERSGHS